MATIKDIAEKVGVSISAVSRVLNYDRKISVNEETRKAIFAAAKELGYKKKITNPFIDDVAVIYCNRNQEEFEEAYYKSIRKELVKQAEERNIHFTVYNKADGLEKIPKTTQAFIGIGWVNQRELDCLKELTPNGIFIGSSPDESFFDSVKPNFDSIVTQIVNYFIKQGHKNIGFMGGTDFDIITEKPLMDVREWSFRESAKYYGVFNEKNIFITENITVNEGYRLAMRAIKELGDNMPTAFCMASDTLTVGALQAFNEMGWDIPKRVSFFSINNISIAKYVSPPLTTFHIDVPLMCDAALTLLQERIIKERAISKTVYINGKPVFRKSFLCDDDTAPSI